jgi:hypothetical protein
MTNRNIYITEKFKTTKVYVPILRVLGKSTFANEVSLLADKVSENAVSERSHQSTL